MVKYISLKVSANLLFLMIGGAYEHYKSYRSLLG